MRSLAGLIALVALTACGAPPVPTQDPDAWQEPPSYAYTLDATCGERNLLGRFRVEVEAGRAVSIVGLDPRSQAEAAIAELEDVPTLAGLVARATDARRGGAERVVLHTDPVDGRPVGLEIDWNVRAMDDEECYEAFDVVVVDPPRP